MAENQKLGALILGAAIVLGLSFLGLILGSSALKIKSFERTVSVKGLSEREYNADIVIWPIQFTAASNNLESLYSAVDGNTAKIMRFLTSKGIASEDVTYSLPAINDK